MDSQQDYNASSNVDLKKAIRSSSRSEMGANKESEPKIQELAPSAPDLQIIAKSSSKNRKKRRFSSDSEGSEGSFKAIDQLPTEDRAVTAPEGTGRNRQSFVQTSGLERSRHNGFSTSTFIEGNLMKAANIYQQFDKKGNLFENRLYAKTSIN